MLGGSCAAVPLVEGPSAFVSVCSAVSVSPMSVSSCAFASLRAAFALAARIRFLTIVFQTLHRTKQQTFYTEPLVM